MNMKILDHYGLQEETPKEKTKSLETKGVYDG
jgi:hypothetical protein